MKDNPCLHDIKAELINNSPVIVVLVDLDQNIVWANKAFQLASGKSLDQMEGKKCFKVWGLTAPCVGCPITATLQSGDVLDGEVIVSGHQNTPYHRGSWLVKASPVTMTDGSITGAVATVFEIPGHARQLDRYEKTMASLMRLLKASTDLSSSELLRMFLDEAEFLTGSSIGFYHFVEEDQTTLSLQMWSTRTLRNCSAPGAGTHYLINQAGVWVDCVRKGEPVIHNDYESLPHKKGLPDGHVPIVRELVVPVVRGKKLLAILGVGNKKTHYNANDVWVVEQLAAMAWEAIIRKRTEEENVVLQEQFRQAQKMESIGRLAGGVAHDFNNMLSIIVGYAELGLDKVESNDVLKDDLHEILSAAKRSAEITKQLLTFARRQTISPLVINLNEAIQGMLKMLRRFIGENIELVWKPASDLWHVKMDPVQIDQLLANLCVNSRDAIHDVGTITIETSNVEITDEYCLENSEFVPGEYVRMTITDNGCGMDRETCAKIFEPFYTTKEDGQGTGLGLATVYGIVKQNGGFINVYSELEKGTIFKIYLTRHRAATPDCIRRDVEKEIIKGKGETILVVEDEPAILNMICTMLLKLGYNALPAATPKEALRQATLLESDIQLVITDVIMPEMNGKALSERLLGLHPNLKCLFMSGYTANSIAHHGVLDEEIVFIEKPMTKNDLANKIREVLDG